MATIYLTPSNISFSDALIRRIVESVEALHNAVPITQLLFDVPNSAAPSDFRYRFIAQDGRVWQQNLQIPLGDPDPLMNFAISDFWRKTTEFQHHRPIRDLLIRARNEKGLTYFRFQL